MLMTALCGGCLVRIIENVLRRCIESQVRSSAASLLACRTRPGSFTTSNSSSSSERSRQARDSLLELSGLFLVTHELHSCAHQTSAFPQGLCGQWLVTLRPVTSAKSQVMHLGMLMTALCGGCLVRIVDSGLRRCIQSQVRSSAPSLLACRTRPSSFTTSHSSSSSQRSRQARVSLLELSGLLLVTHEPS